MKTSDTPRSDAAEYHQYDTQPPLPLGLVDVEFARKLETELNTAIVNEAFAENKTYTLEKQLKQANERIKRLEELYEGEIGENEQFLGSNLKGLLIREINECNKIIRQQQLLDEENLMLKERIERLEDVLQTAWFLMANVNWKRKKDPDMYKDFVNWRDNDFLPVMRWQKRKDTKAKEAKL